MAEESEDKGLVGSELGGLGGCEWRIDPVDFSATHDSPSPPGASLVPLYDTLSPLLSELASLAYPLYAPVSASPIVSPSYWLNPL